MFGLLDKGPRLGALVVGLACAWAIPVSYSVHAGLPHNPISLPFESEVAAPLWAPQGWKFFTRDPQEEQMGVRLRVDGEWRAPTNSLNASAANAFGARREGRALAAEAGTFVADVPHSSWHECAESDSSCYDALKPIAVRSKATHPLLCGDVLLTYQKPVPWAWARSPTPVHMPLRAVRLAVTC